MADHKYRVRQSTPAGIKVIGFYDTFAKASADAARRTKKTGTVHRVEHRPHLRTSWETAQELTPQTRSAVEAEVARGRLPQVQDSAGRKGRVLGYVRGERQARVAWLDVEKPGRGERIAVDQLSLR